MGVESYSYRQYNVVAHETMEGERTGESISCSAAVFSVSRGLSRLPVCAMPGYRYAGTIRIGGSLVVRRMARHARPTVPVLAGIIASSGYMAQQTGSLGRIGLSDFLLVIAEPSFRASVSSPNRAGCGTKVSRKGSPDSRITGTALRRSGGLSLQAETYSSTRLAEAAGPGWRTDCWSAPLQVWRWRRW
jgi:hypothetical protein